MSIAGSSRAHWSRNENLFEANSGIDNCDLLWLEGGPKISNFHSSARCLWPPRIASAIIRIGVWGAQHDLSNENALLISWFPSEIKVIYFSLCFLLTINSKGALLGEERGWSLCSEFDIHRKRIRSWTCNVTIENFMTSRYCVAILFGWLSYILDWDCDFSEKLWNVHSKFCIELINTNVIERLLASIPQPDVPWGKRLSFSWTEIHRRDTTPTALKL